LDGPRQVSEARTGTFPKDTGGLSVQRGAFFASISRINSHRDVHQPNNLPFFPLLRSKVLRWTPAQRA
jgi:hypothetical protein